jgi:anaerobic selenocysteine-containing dehydrogenase
MTDSSTGRPGFEGIIANAVTSPNDSTEIVRGACGHDCPDTCAWVVEVRNGSADRLYGDPDHPFTRGTLCAKVNHYLERVYHPDRVLHPLKRVGPKGEGRFARVTWDEALTDIASRWHAIVGEFGAEAILPYSSAGVQGLIQQASIDLRLFGSMGCSDLDRNICGAVATAGLSATIGTGTGIDPEEIVHSRYVVLWGTNTIVTNLHFWPFVREAQRRGAKIVVVDPVRTRTADSADWHLPIKPASDAVLALAMMHVIIRDGLVDHEYVSQHAVRYEALAERALQYAPATVAETVGLPADVIERFAREYATTQPSLVRALIGPEHHRNGAMQFRAMACLPVLTGAWRHRGGGLARSTHKLHFAVLAMDRVEMREVYKPGVRVLNMRDLGKDLCDPALAPPIKSLMVYGANPMVSMPNQSRIREGLLRDDLFTVVHDLFVTDTALYADYVLPATSQIEHLDLSPAWGHLYLALNRPAIPPRGESLSNTELFRRLARALGRTEPYLFESDESMLRAALASGHPWLRGTGAPGGDVEGITYERLWEEGYARLNHPEDWRPFANGGFPTPSGKAALYSEALRDAGHDPLPWAGEIRTGRGLQLITGKQLHFLNSGYSNQDRHRRRAGELFIEIHPEDARQRGIATGSTVSVRAGRNEVRAVCRVSDRVRPGVVWMPFGGLTDATGQRRSVNTLTAEEPTDWGGGSGLYDAFVEVEPAQSSST